MQTAKQLGNTGEKTVADYAKQKGMRLIASNYYSRYGEIDLICQDKDHIVFTEVKMRNERSPIYGLELVSKGKRKKIIKTAYSYIQKNNIETQPRFDVAEIRCNNQGNPVKIIYINDAFGLEECDEIF